MNNAAQVVDCLGWFRWVLSRRGASLPESEVEICYFGHPPQADEGARDIYLEKPAVTFNCAKHLSKHTHSENSMTLFRLFGLTFFGPPPRRRVTFNLAKHSSNMTHSKNPVTLLAARDDTLFQILTKAT